MLQTTFLTITKTVFDMETSYFLQLLSAQLLGYSAIVWWGWRDAGLKAALAKRDTLNTIMGEKKVASLPGALLTPSTQIEISPAEVKTSSACAQKLSSEMVQQAPEVLGQAPELLARAPEALGQAPEVLVQAPEVLGQAPEVPAQAPKVLAQAPEFLARAPKVLGQAPKVPAHAPEGLGQAPEGLGQAPEVLFHAIDPTSPVALHRFFQSLFTNHKN